MYVVRCTSQNGARVDLYAIPILGYSYNERALILVISADWAGVFRIGQPNIIFASDIVHPSRIFSRHSPRE